MLGLRLSRWWSNRVTRTYHCQSEYQNVLPAVLIHRPLEPGQGCPLRNCRRLRRVPCDDSSEDVPEFFFVQTSIVTKAMMSIFGVSSGQSRMVRDHS